MRLYFIKRNHDGKFFCGINGHYILQGGVAHEVGQSWAEEPQLFLKTADGIAKNLRRLCSIPYWHITPPAGVCAGVAYKWRELSWKDFDEKKLRLYSVVAMDVNVLSVTATPANEFIQIDAISGAKLSRADK